MSDMIVTLVTSVTATAYSSVHTGESVSFASLTSPSLPLGTHSLGTMGRIILELRFHPQRFQRLLRGEEKCLRRQVATSKTVDGEMA